ncbi:Uncharacterised protein [Segatella copri]|nr:Uncharacterised protein [Segatella copri]
MKLSLMQVPRLSVIWSWRLCHFQIDQRKSQPNVIT